MMTTDERYELMSTPGANNDAPAYWIQDVTTVAGDAPGDPLAMIEVTLPDAQPVTTVWETPVLTTEAVVVLTIARADAATIVARVLAALNGGTNE